MAWELNGNAIGAIPEPGAFLGTTDAQPLIIRTGTTLADNLRMTITPSGEVGIGKAPAANYKLEVAGTVNATDYHKNGSALVSSQWTDVSGGINYAGGNVGIGTPTPGAGAKLTVADGDITWGNNSRLARDQGGSIELGGDSDTPGTGTPYIDFHFSGVTQDFNTRIQNDANGQLTISAGALRTLGDVAITGRATVGAGVSGISDGGFALFGRNTSEESGIGVYAEGRIAGLFAGEVDVVGDLTVINGNKPFKIDHPLDPQNKYLLHNAVEAPERKNVYDGLARLDEDGEAWVELPEWFEALNGDFRYQLTAVGVAIPNLHVAEEVSENRFKIAGGQEGMKVCWQLTGSRKDPWAAANPFEVEQEKPQEERGRYLEPSLYDAPEEQRVMLGPIAEAVEEEQRPPEPSGIDLARLEEEHRRQIDELRRQQEEHRREMEERPRRTEERQEEAPPESM